ncbi:transglutaminase family protein [Saccharicrinis sp. GN24d3]|uniref:transglutaminase family protein n=1 Tax=Saccharicrinis sp. GN24d3 TaxID=3458416 RepID=UPI00403557D8
MKFKIIHLSEYHFSSKVFLEPHYLRFKPKFTPHNIPDSFDLQISPEPSGISEHLDAENNLLHLCWFDGLVDKLRIKAESVVHTYENNPFGFILYPSSCFNLPFAYPDSVQSVLRNALVYSEISEALIEYGRRIEKQSKHQTIPFLTQLTRQIHTDFTIESRETGYAYAADKTFQLKTGSCRDVAWMQIQLLRNMGIASRFVSGYYYIPIENPEFELHAWIEVYLPGAGWVGFDPSNGIVAGHTHIPIASSVQFENTMPVTGTIRGSATSVLTINLSIKPLD